MTERKLVRKFTLDMDIYDIELPQKVSAILQAEPLDTDPHFYYTMDIVFDKAVYQIPEFFQYPLEKLPPSPPNRRNKMTKQEQLRERLSAILSQQLEQVSSAVKDTGLELSNSSIIGDDLKHLHQVTLEFYRGNEKEYDKKGRLKQVIFGNSIVPDRPFIIDRMADFFAKMIVEKKKEEKKREQEQASHIPHMVPARELFIAAAKAILLDHKQKTSEDIVALADQLRLHAKVQSDWPLEIGFAERPDDPMTEDAEIDCPEFLLYHETNNGNWTLKKVENLSAAQFQITKSGYNRKSTVRMAVLQNMRPLGFSLFTETTEGLVKVRTQDASKAKKLYLSWKNNDYICSQS